MVSKPVHGLMHRFNQWYFLRWQCPLRCCTTLAGQKLFRSIGDWLLVVPLVELCLGPFFWRVSFQNCYLKIYASYLTLDNAVICVVESSWESSSIRRMEKIYRVLKVTEPWADCPKRFAIGPLSGRFGDRVRF